MSTTVIEISSLILIVSFNFLLSTNIAVTSVLSKPRATSPGLSYESPKPLHETWEPAAVESNHG